jgi:FtsH-binding integral membrane protein
MGMFLFPALVAFCVYSVVCFFVGIHTGLLLLAPCERANVLLVCCWCVAAAPPCVALLRPYALPLSLACALAILPTRRLARRRAGYTCAFFGAVLFSGFIVYDTHQIMTRMGCDDYVRPTKP